MTELSNIDFTILHTLCLEGSKSGYELNTIIEERGYRNWADIGKSSIYSRLKILLNKKILNSYIDDKKSGKGPLPIKYSVTKEGRKILLKKIYISLSQTRERNCRFDLGIAAMTLLDKSKIIQALEERIIFLQENKSNVSKIKKSNQEKSINRELPLNVLLLFEHPEVLLKTEIEFVNSIIKRLKKEMHIS